MGTRTRAGQSVVEMVAGTMVVIPIILFLLDIGTLIVANYINDDLCTRAARAAANQSTADEAKASAQRVLQKLDTSKTGILTDLKSLDAAGKTPAGELGFVDYDNVNPGHIVAATRISVKLPVPFPFLPQTADFTSRSVLPIVAQKAR
ncbi:MAG: hypothetical protein K2X77_01295 [Candidatus Obscuribacterales bacterium]|jgi:hypothetical protein|nr:hypothetical protein [Candidatus Obscuribacterales bacterium]